MLQFEQKKSKAEKLGEKLGFLAALIIFVSLFTFLFSKYKIIQISLRSYLFLILAVTFVYMSLWAIRKK